MEREAVSRSVTWTFNQRNYQATVSGFGSRIMLCFHGYGQHEGVFQHWIPLLEKEYTFVCFDLAYHGKHPSLTKHHIWDDTYAKAWFEALQTAMGFETCSILGYSIGARIAMHVAGIMPRVVTELFLLAPDGAPVAATYRWLTGSHVGNSIFRAFVKNPKLALGLIRFGKSFGILAPQTADFYQYEIRDISKRLQLYRTWRYYRRALPNYTRLKTLVSSKQLAIVAVLGLRDAVIPFKPTRSFLMRALKSLQIIEVDAGHNLLSEKAVRRFMPFWENKKGDPMDRLYH